MKGRGADAGPRATAATVESLAGASDAVWDGVREGVSDGVGDALGVVDDDGDKLTLAVRLGELESDVLGVTLGVCERVRVPERLCDRVGLRVAACDALGVLVVESERELVCVRLGVRVAELVPD